ncbi:MAG TPA: DegV family protein [Firmicutes bacterium]|nr:DegV family protein [Bacillota bacterium]
MKEKIGIITDSTCDIPREFLNKLGIKVLPLRILYQGREYRDGVDITAEAVYAHLEQEVPTTSLPSPQDAESLLLSMKEQGYTHVLVIHLSSGLSGTGQMIETVAEQIDGMTVKVIDSKSISMGLGFIVMEAARAVQAKMNFEAVCNLVSSVRDRLSVYFVLSTLEYLKKGGRIGKVSGTIGELLQLKPIITVNKEGIYTTFAKVRGKKQALDRLVGIAKEHISKAASQIAVCYGGAQEEAAYIIKQIGQLANVKELITSSVSPVIGVHTGPGTVGFAVLESN